MMDRTVIDRIVALRSGGQSGADRGAMDAALACGVPVQGWCPAGGWAEDYPDPPGVLELYPNMQPTPSSDVAQRTEWNIRDSSCCIVLNTCARDVSRGTDIGYALYEKYGTPYFEITLGEGADSLDEQVDCARAWLEHIDGDDLILGVGGPRASEYPGIYDIAYHVVKSLLSP